MCSSTPPPKQTNFESRTAYEFIAKRTQTQTRTEPELEIFYIHRTRTEPELRFFKINRTEPEPKKQVRTRALRVQYCTLVVHSYTHYAHAHTLDEFEFTAT